MSFLPTRRSRPTQRDATHFDTLIVLGSPADPDGKPSPEQRERVMEAVREFRAGRASHIIVSGGAAHNQWSEAGTMARIAESAGVPSQDIVPEPPRTQHHRKRLLQRPNYAAARLDERRGGEFAQPPAARRADPRALPFPVAKPRPRTGRRSTSGGESRPTISTKPPARPRCAGSVTGRHLTCHRDSKAGAAYAALAMLESKKPPSNSSRSINTR